MKSYFASVEKVVVEGKAYIAIRIIGAKRLSEVPKSIDKHMKARGYRWQKSYFNNVEFVERGWYYKRYEAKEFKFMSQFVEQAVKVADAPKPEAKAEAKPKLDAKKLKALKKDELIDIVLKMLG